MPELLSANDADAWCEEHLPEVYDPGMFDDEGIHDDVLDSVGTLIQETFLDLMDLTAADRDAFHDELMETAVDWLDSYHVAMIESLSAIPPTALLVRPQTTQHSVDWYSQRRNRLTASEFAQILDGRRGALQRSKVAPVSVSDFSGAAAQRTAPIAISQSDGEMNATSWGHRFEPIVRKIYEIEIAGPGTVIDDLGRFTHKEIPWLSASPDGVVARGSLAGRLLEIKAPKTRQPGLFVPSEYYVQMQIQMEVCDMPAVDFVEAQFAQHPATAITATTDASATARYKGRIRICGFSDQPETWIAQYSEPVEDLDDAVLPPPPTDMPILEESIWWLTGWHPRTVLRNDEWWQTIGRPAAELFWAEVESLREVTIADPYDMNAVIVHEGTGWIGSATTY